MRYPHIPWLPLLFYPALPVAAAAGLLLWQDWPPALALIVPYVPWVMALIGIAICLMYQRSQTMALMLSVLVAAAAWPALAEQAPWALGPALAWWALAYTINALWAERSSVLLDLTARLGLMASGAAAIALAGKEGTADFFSTLAVQGALARLGVPVEALAALLATGLTLTLLLLRYGRPQQAGQWLGFVCMAWALPRGAQHPIELALMSAAALTSLSISLAHEGFHMAFRDELTGLPGRRALNEKLQRMGRVYTLAMADVDHFKAFNDTHGHDVGDQVLRMVAAQLRRVSGGGHAYRYGGEEFTLVFPGKTAAESMPHLEAVRRAIEAYQMRLRDKPARPRTDQAGLRRRGARGGRNTRPLRVTVSIGVAERGDALRAPEAVIKAADQALYKAKDGGRNQVCSYGAPARQLGLKRRHAASAPRAGSCGRPPAACAAAGRSVAGQAQRHQSFVVRHAVHAQPFRLDAVLREAQALVQRARGKIAGRDAQLQLAHAAHAAGVVDGGQHQPARQSAPARGRRHVHAPDLRLVAHLQSVLPADAGHAGQRAVDEHAEHGVLDVGGDPGADVVQRERMFLFVTRSERFRRFAQGVQAQLAQGCGVGGRQSSYQRIGHGGVLGNGHALRRGNPV